LFEDSLEQKIRKLVLEQQKQNKNQWTLLEDVKVVETADVPIIKMRFMAIMIDISIGQLAGFCTLHFMNYAD
jgi:DNA polymerase sigma